MILFRAEQQSLKWHFEDIGIVIFLQQTNHNLLMTDHQSVDNMKPTGG